jgi:vacuolar-type H+-ATPase subunit I/STV1
MLDRTRFLARLIGVYCLLAAVMMGLQRAAMIAAVSAAVHDAPLMLVLGTITLAAGLALVLSHNLWSGGALTVVVTVIGWLTLLKGLMFWVLPPGGVAAELYLERLHYAQLYNLYCAFTLVTGLYLTLGGFRAPPAAR